MKYYFSEIKDKRILKGICCKCEKKGSRTVEECQTINPFNKNLDGTVKSELEVQQSVKTNLQNRIDRFIKEGFVCKSCKKYLGY